MATTAAPVRTALSPRPTTDFDPVKIESFLDHIAMMGRSPNTIRKYREDLTGLLRWAQDQPPTDDEVLAARYLTEHRARWAPKTTCRRLGTLRAFGRWTGHPAFLTSYKPPTPARPVPHPIPEGIDGVQAMLEAVDGITTGSSHEKAGLVGRRALVALCGYCGLRVGEALSIGAADVDVQARLLTVRGKGDKTRTVPISERAWPYVEAAINAALLYGSPTLVRLRDRWARQLIKNLADAAGLSRDVSSHDLRATLATAAYDKGHDLRAVQELLGHANSSTTEAYTGVTMSGMRVAVEL